MRSLTRLGIVVETISKFARELERYHPELHEKISKEVIRRYVVREGKGSFTNTAPSASKRRLGEAGQDLFALAIQFRNTAAAKLSSFTILERVLHDQFEIVDVVAAFHGVINHGLFVVLDAQFFLRPGFGGIHAPRGELGVAARHRFFFQQDYPGTCIPGGHGRCQARTARTNHHDIRL